MYLLRLRIFPSFCVGFNDHLLGGSNKSSIPIFLFLSKTCSSGHSWKVEFPCWSIFLAPDFMNTLMVITCFTQWFIILSGSEHRSEQSKRTSIAAPPPKDLITIVPRNREKVDLVFWMCYYCCLAECLAECLGYKFDLPLQCVPV